MIVNHLALTTPWDKMEVSEATAKHLKLGDYSVWTRTDDGLSLFIVLQAGKEPDLWTPGYGSLEMAMSARG